MRTRGRENPDAARVRRVSRYDEDAGHVLFLMVVWGKDSGFVRIEHLLLALALYDIDLVRGLQLPPRGHIELPNNPDWLGRPLISLALGKILFALPFSDSPETVGPGDLAAAFKRFLADPSDLIENDEPILLDPGDFHPDDHLILRSVGLLRGEDR